MPTHSSEKKSYQISDKRVFGHMTCDASDCFGALSAMKAVNSKNPMPEVRSLSFVCPERADDMKKNPGCMVNLMYESDDARMKGTKPDPRCKVKFSDRNMAVMWCPTDAMHSMIKRSSGTKAPEPTPDQTAKGLAHAAVAAKTLIEVETAAEKEPTTLTLRKAANPVTLQTMGLKR